MNETFSDGMCLPKKRQYILYHSSSFWEIYKPEKYDSKVLMAVGIYLISNIANYFYLLDIYNISQITSYIA